MMRTLFEAQAISVGELCRRIRGALRAQFPAPVRVLGEISRCRRIDGHVYFSLKDSEGYIDCICFQSTAQSLRLTFPLEDGAAVEVDGFVDIWMPKSAYQLRVTGIVPVGKGALHLAFERLKAELLSEGLFDDARKRPIPSFIRNVAIVTSKNAAALADFVTTCRRRGAHVGIQLVAAPVQGAAAAPSLARAIRAAGRLPVDVVVIARGGGSIEDLWAFNTEQVARAIAACARPVISAVGHETDFTIADFVADKRAPTPTAAAEFVAQERGALLARISACEMRLRRALKRLAAIPGPALRRAIGLLRRGALSMVLERAQRLDDVGAALVRCDPRHRIQKWRERSVAASVRLPVLGRRTIGTKRAALAAVQRQLSLSLAHVVREQTTMLEVASAKLAALGPRQTLQRGYAIVYDSSGGVLTESVRARIGENIGVELKSGWLGATVTEKKHEQERKADF